MKSVKTQGWINILARTINWRLAWWRIGPAIFAAAHGEAAGLCNLANLAFFLDPNAPMIGEGLAVRGVQREVAFLGGCPRFPADFFGDLVRHLDQI